MTNTWTKQTDWMRAQGATAATWAIPSHGGDELVLMSVVLGPAPKPPAPVTTQHPDSGDEPAEAAPTRSNPHVSGLVKAGHGGSRVG